MEKFLKILSNIFLIFNTFAAVIGIGSLFNGNWYFFPLAVIFILLNFKFYFYAHKKEMAEFDEKLKEIRKTHTYIGCDEYGDVWYYKNNETGEVIQF